MLMLVIGMIIYWVVIGWSYVFKVCFIYVFVCMIVVMVMFYVMFEVCLILLFFVIVVFYLFVVAGIVFEVFMIGRR